MMDLSITKDEQNAFKRYINEKYEEINQMLVSNAEVDLELMSDDIENDVVNISYNIEDVKRLLNNIASNPEIIAEVRNSIHGYLKTETTWEQDMNVLYKFIE